MCRENIIIVFSTFAQLKRVTLTPAVRQQMEEQTKTIKILQKRRKSVSGHWKRKHTELLTGKLTINLFLFDRIKLIVGAINFEEADVELEFSQHHHKFCHKRNDLRFYV